MQWTRSDGSIVKIVDIGSMAAIARKNPETNEILGFMNAIGKWQQHTFFFGSVEVETYARKYLGCPDGEGDTPEQLAYDEIDQID